MNRTIQGGFYYFFFFLNLIRFKHSPLPDNFVLNDGQNTLYSDNCVYIYLMCCWFIFRFDNVKQHKRINKYNDNNNSNNQKQRISFRFAFRMLLAFENITFVWFVIIIVCSLVCPFDRCVLVFHFGFWRIFCLSYAKHSSGFVRFLYRNGNVYLRLNVLIFNMCSQVWYAHWMIHRMRKHSCAIAKERMTQKSKIPTNQNTYRKTTIERTDGWF